MTWQKAVCALFVFSIRSNARIRPDDPAGSPPHRNQGPGDIVRMNQVL